MNDNMIAVYYKEIQSAIRPFFGLFFVPPRSFNQGLGLDMTQHIIQKVEVSLQQSAENYFLNIPFWLDGFLKFVMNVIVSTAIANF